MWNLNNKKYLIIGGTGSLGQKLTQRILDIYNPEVIRVYSRDEFKQYTMQKKFAKYQNIRYLVGDVRDKNRLSMAMKNVDIVINTAAMKHVPLCEYNPFEAVKTNVIGTQNMIDCCLEASTSLCLFISTDKSVSPINTYGATKLLAERLTVAANFYKGSSTCRFSCVRYGNVFGSRGSVIHTFLEKKKDGQPLPVTSSDMKRFHITLDQATDLILYALKNMYGGEIYVPDLPVYSIMQLISALNHPYNIIGVRPGEKIFESLINFYEAQSTFREDKYFVIFPPQEICKTYSLSYRKSGDVLGHEYISDPVTMTIDDLKGEIECLLQEM